MSVQINIDNVHNIKELHTSLSSNTLEEIISSLYLELKKRKKSFSQKLAMGKEKKRICNKISSLLLDFLKSKYNTDKEQILIEKKWDKILEQACINLGLSVKQALIKASNIPLLIKELDQIILAIEAKGFIPYKNSILCEGETAKNFVKYLLHDISLNKEVANWKSFKSLFIKKDEQFLQEVREEFNQILLLLYKELVEDKKHHEDVIEMFIGHILSIYVLTDPKHGTIISIPQKIQKQWELIDYSMEIISLTPDFLGQPINAYSLLPITKGPFHPLFIFKSTPHPTGKSSLLAMMSDFTPFCAVGESLYFLAKKKLANWVRTNHKKYNRTIKIYGQSLGGTLAYFLAHDHPEHVEIHTYVPAGLFKRSLKSLKEIKGKTFSHNSDMIGLVNHHPENLSSIKVLTNLPRKNPLLAHFRLFGCDQTILLKVNTKKDNKRMKRKIFSFVHQILAFPLFIIKSTILLLIMGIKQIVKLF